MIRPDASTPNDAGEPRQPVWSRTRLFGVRFASVVTVSALVHFSTLLSSGLFFTLEAELRVTSRVQPLEHVETVTATSVGTFVVSRLGGDHAALADLAQRYLRVSGLIPFCYVLGVLVMGLAVALAWSVGDRRTVAAATLYRVMRAGARYTLAITMMGYALVKVLPTQFGFLTPAELLQPLGQLSRFWLLWDFMAVSLAYTVFTGLVEMAGVVLLFFPTTAIAGALLLAGALTNVIVMDVGYRVQVAATEVAMLLLVLDLVVLAPYVPALVALVRRRGQTLPTEPKAATARW